MTAREAPRPRQDEALICVGFLLFADGSVLVERRRSDRRLLPGILAVPGGHLEPGESPETALARELREELDVTAVESRYLCSLLHQSDELRCLDYFAVPRWQGEIRVLEAAAVEWLPLTAIDRLDLEVDRIACRELQRLYPERS